MRLRRSPAFVTSVLACASALTAQLTVYDDFNGPTISNALWHAEKPLRILSQSGGLLHAKGPPSSLYGNLNSTHGFRGDFEFVLDWRNFKATTTVFKKNVPQIWLQVTDHLQSDKNFVYVSRSFNGTGQVFSGARLGGVRQTGKSQAVTATAGQLRITRTGSAIRTFYKVGLGWNPMQVFTSAFSGIATVQVAAFSGDNGTFQVDSDSIQYRGQNLEPPRRYGAGCNSLRMEWDSWPVLGIKTFKIGTRGAPPLAPLLVFLGTSDKLWGAIRLPLDLSPLLAPGCWLLTGIELPTLITADQNGFGILPLLIPRNASLTGRIVFAQCMAVNQNANPLGLSWSDALAIKLQK
ncbi:MAG: hypothetical protein ACE5F1_12845 [Planctomycetota bacterium]